MLNRKTEQGEVNTEHSSFNEEQYLQQKVNSYNNTKGTLDYYDCDKCLNKGNIMHIQDGVEFISICKCMQIRNANKFMTEMLKDSGIADSFENCTFDSFKVRSEWQRYFKGQIVEYTNAPDGWLYVSGQVGSGKTHLCTAAVGELIKQGKTAFYMPWLELVNRFTGINDVKEENKELVEKIKTVDVLYIDDFLKTDAINKTKKDYRPTTGEIKVAYKIINARCNSKDKIIVISSEFSLEDVVGFDEAVGSRIKQECKDNDVHIAKGKDRNYRLFGKDVEI